MSKKGMIFAVIISISLGVVFLFPSLINLDLLTTSNQNPADSEVPMEPEDPTEPIIEYLYITDTELNRTDFIINFTECIMKSQGSNEFINYDFKIQRFSFGILYDLCFEDLMNGEHPEFYLIQEFEPHEEVNEYNAFYAYTNSSQVEFMGLDTIRFEIDNVGQFELYSNGMPLIFEEGITYEISILSINMVDLVDGESVVEFLLNGVICTTTLECETYSDY